ncbi:alpha/beta hydrolase-fold protein [Paenisporosarcina quisquiliarum]|uniref:Alpha/beta hydrolase-fold protein n=1 Tax=Paenisporosarcina quisquiliarum TaxID=365346 RepID=A0A9X3LHF7_9BACL|nr:alpha/beta hydrolase-fold protein [Paenisporosarcina quisquiliarum]MCZ8537762.1 alpha/beta hydrolase-fold protein [Paenisporosarcina quisquiliarum]
MLENFNFPISAFNHDRTIRVYTPFNYGEENKRYPVLYMHDGQNVFQDEEAIKGISLELKNYLDERKFEIIVVGIDTNIVGDERKNEYCPWVDGEYSMKLSGQVSTTGGKGAAYVDFIVHELKPYIDRTYRTLEDSTSIAGISLGGLISTYSAARYPQVFTKVASISSAFWRNQEEIEKLLNHADLSSIEKFYMDAGTKEVPGDERISNGFLESNQRVYEILKEKIPDIRFEILEDGEHSYSFFRKRVAAVISYLYGQ